MVVENRAQGPYCEFCEAFVEPVNLVDPEQPAPFAPKPARPAPPPIRSTGNAVRDADVRAHLKLLEKDPDDARLLVKVAELYQKAGDRAEAAKYFLRVAHAYQADGFSLKAVAVLKQVLKLGADTPQIRIELSQSYERLGLAQDAARQLKVACARIEEGGDSGQAASLYDKLAALLEAAGDDEDAAEARNHAARLRGHDPEGP